MWLIISTSWDSCYHSKSLREPALVTISHHRVVSNIKYGSCYVFLHFFCQRGVICPYPTLPLLAPTTVLGPSTWTSLAWRHNLKTCFLYSLKFHSGPVGHGKLTCNVLEHFLHPLPCLARGLVHPRDQVVALLTKGLHVWICDLDSALLIILVSTP